MFHAKCELDVNSVFISVGQVAGWHHFELCVYGEKSEIALMAEVLT